MSAINFKSFHYIYKRSHFFFYYRHKTFSSFILLLQFKNSLGWHKA